MNVGGSGRRKERRCALLERGSRAVIFSTAAAPQITAVVFSPRPKRASGVRSAPTTPAAADGALPVVAEPCQEVAAAQFITLSPYLASDSGSAIYLALYRAVGCAQYRTPSHCTLHVPRRTRA